MGRGRVEVPPVLLGVLAVVALVAGQPEDALLEDRVLTVPQGEGDAEELAVVADAGQPILVPAEGARSRVVVGGEFPGAAAVAIVLAHRARGTFAQVRTPSPPAR